jgi:hypothetical protein
MIARGAPGHKEITMADQSWTWPAGRMLVLYHWSWFDPALGEVVVGWSQRGELDNNGFVHLEAEESQPARSIAVDPDLDPIVKAHILSPLTRLPGELREDDGKGPPLPWVRVLLGG